jgi:hypothetical protein
MADKHDHSEEGKKLLRDMRDKGITDLDGLVRRLMADKTAAPSARKLLCDRNHFCIVVPK